MKTPCHLILLVISAIAVAATSIAEAAETARKPNVLFIAIDDLRPELGCYGNTHVISPNIDKLASEGVLFNRAYCQVPVCGASRASLMTGILPTPQRFTVARTHAEDDAPGAATLPQVFREAGYTTISNGKIFHFGDDTQDRSWSENAWHSGQSHSMNLDPATAEKKSATGRNRMYESPDVPDNAYGDGKVAEKTISDLRRLKASGQPFFLACGFIRPHMPFYAPKKYWDLYDLKQDPKENHNLAANPGRQNDLAHMQRLLKASEETAAQAKVAQPLPRRQEDAGVAPAD